MAAGCPFLTCAVKTRGIEFCWECNEKDSCEKWKKHRGFCKNRDSFKCYQTLERDIAFIEKHGVRAFEKAQAEREELLKTMMAEFNEGRSMSYYCIAATVLEIGELRMALAKAKKASLNLGIKDRAEMLHFLLDEIAKRKNCALKLRN